MRGTCDKCGGTDLELRSTADGTGRMFCLRCKEASGIPTWLWWALAVALLAMAAMLIRRHGV